MKSLQLMGGREKILADDEAENVKKLLNNQSIRFVELRDGSAVNITSIVSIDEIEKIPYWSVYEVQENKLGKYIIREGEKCFLTPENIKDITFKEPEVYAKNPGVLRQLQQGQGILPESV